MSDITIRDLNLERLKEVASRMVKAFPKRLTIGLVGTLGAGKTTFTQALAAAAGVDPDDVTSPTFTLLGSYQATIDAGPVCIHHMDAYRVSDEDEFIELGVDELFDADDAWVIVEWADRVECVMPDDTLWIRLEIQAQQQCDDSNRSMTFATDDAELAELAAAMKD